MITLKGRLGFGTSHLHRMASHAERQAVLATAYEAGVRHYDSARLYGHGIAESELGQFIRGRRAELTIATKVGYRFPFYGRTSRIIPLGTKVMAAAEKFAVRKLTGQSKLDYLLEGRDFSVAALQRSFSASLTALQTDYVDVLFLHEFEPAVCRDTSAVFAWLVKTQHAGLIRSFGISSERHRCMASHSIVPELCGVMQVGDTYQAGDAAPMHIDGAIPQATYGYFRGARLDVRALAERITFAIDRNPQGMVLFSSTNVENIRAFVKAFRTADAVRRDQQR